MYEVWDVKDLPIKEKCQEAITALMHEYSIEWDEALELLIEEWIEGEGYSAKARTIHENPLDAIEAKLERISILCDQVIRKLDLDSL